MKFGQTYVPIKLDDKSVNNLNHWLSLNDSKIDIKFDELIEAEKIVNKTSDGNHAVEKPAAAVHDSVRELQKLYPKIILPDEVLNVNINPKINIRYEDSKAIETWLKNEAKLQTLPGDIVVKKISSNENCCNRYKTSIFQKTNDESEVQKKEKKIEIDGESELFKINGVVIKKVSENSNNVVKPGKKRPCPEYSPSELKPPQKKRVFTKESLAIPRLEVPSQSPQSWEMQKKLLTSSLELTTIAEASSIKSKKELEDAGKNLLTLQTKTVEVFICKFCNKVFDNQRQLKYHMKVHLICKICRMKFQNIQQSLKHLHNGCPKITTNLPWIKICRVDKIPSIVLKYKKIFDEFFTEIKGNDSIECSSNISGDTFCLNNSDCEVDEPEPIPIKVEELNVPRLSLVNSFDDTLLEPMKVEEIEDETIESVSKIRPKVMLVDECRQLFDPPTLLNEDTLLNNLFSYHNKIHAEAQTMPPTIKLINSSCILLENMASELEHSRIPIELTVNATLSASFVVNNVKKEPCDVLFSWNHLNPVDVCQKPQIPNIAAVPKIADNIQLALNIAPTVPPTNPKPKPAVITNEPITTTTLQQPTYYIINQPGTSTNIFNPQQQPATIPSSSTPQTTFSFPIIVSNPLTSTPTPQLLSSVPITTSTVSLPGIQHAIVTPGYKHISPTPGSTSVIIPTVPTLPGPVVPNHSVKRKKNGPSRSSHTQAVFDPQVETSMIIVRSSPPPSTKTVKILPSPVPSVTDILKTPLIKSNTEQQPSTSDLTNNYIRVKKPWEVNASL